MSQCGKGWGGDRKADRGKGFILMLSFSIKLPEGEVRSKVGFLQMMKTKYVIFRMFFFLQKYDSLFKCYIFVYDFF
jgi:hypothetical protein